MTTTKWNNAKTNVTSFFGGLVDQYGYDLRSLDFGARESQLKRFEVIAQYLPDTEFSLLDVGCGFAELADFLESQGFKVKYRGIDLTPQMIEQASKRRPDLNLMSGNIVDGVIDDTFDYVISSGIFYMMGENAEQLMMELVQKMFSMARRRVIFNTISTWADRTQPGEFYADPLRTISACREITRNMVFRHDYMPHDFTIVLNKPGHL
jgi:SAM-dependent methyltransferase